MPRKVLTGQVTFKDECYRWRNKGWPVALPTVLRHFWIDGGNAWSRHEYMCCILHALYQVGV